MSGNKKIRFISASDRINYGDLLFPLIFKQFLTEINNEINFENYGIIKSDLSDFGALKTKSFKTLESEIKNGDKLVIGGGEVLFANWTTLYSFINPRFRFLLRYKKMKTLEKKFKFARNLLSNNKVLFPFSFDASDFKLVNLKVYYSSVGGGHLLSKSNYLQSQAYNRLKSARLISLRDNRSYNYLQNSELEVKLVPDSALLMSNYYTNDYLKAKMDRCLTYDNYIFLQLGINKGPKDLKKFAELVDDLAVNLKCKVLLCAVGLAPGHKDDKILREIKALKPHFDFLVPKNIFEIMYLIANSNLYLGTSLHGAITAMSFLVPAIGLNKKISKLESYMKTWISPDFENLDFNEIEYNGINRLINLFEKAYTSKILLNQKSMITSNLEEIIND